jgi:hypothetical protein
VEGAEVQAERRSYSGISPDEIITTNTGDIRNVAQSSKAWYRQRENRFHDAVALRKPDRVPIVLFAEFFLTKYQGLTNRETLYDYERMAQAWQASMIEFDWDMAPIPLGMFPGPAIE